MQVFLVYGNGFTYICSRVNTKFDLYPCRFIPESARWLQLRGREDEARQQLAKIAAINGKEMPNENLKKVEGSGEAGNFKHLFYNWKVGKITLISWNLW